MLLNKTSAFLNKLSVRLLIIYGTLFLLGLIFIYALTVFSLAQSLNGRMDGRLKEEAHEIDERYQMGGMDGLEKAFAFEMEEEDLSEMFFRLVTPDRKLVFASSLSQWSGVNFEHLLKSFPGSDEYLMTIVFDTQRNHKVMVVQKRIASGDILQIGHILTEDEELLKSYKKRFESVVLVMFPIFGIFIWFLTKQVVKGIQQVTIVAGQISRGDFRARVSLEQESTEVMLLAKTFNSMSEKNELLIKEMRDVTHNIAHDLRSPITRIRGAAETTLRGDQRIEDYQEMAGTVIDECDSLKNMINILLEIAEADSGISNIKKEKMDFKKLTVEGHELFMPLAKEKNISFDILLDSAELLIVSNLQQTQRVISNLLDNAIKYTPREGRILVRVAGDDSWAILSVIDSGIGLPEKDLENIFKPFYRQDQSRSTSGNGLGLSFVQSVVKSNGGLVSVISELGKGSTFTVKFPRVV